MISDPDQERSISDRANDSYLVGGRSLQDMSHSLSRSSLERGFYLTTMQLEDLPFFQSLGHFSAVAWSVTDAD